MYTEERRCLQLYQKPKDYYLVTQSNDLIEARYTEPLTRNEQKILITMISLIQPHDEDFKEYSITVKDYAELLGLSAETEPYGYLKKLMKQLMSRVLEVPSVERGGWKMLHWVSTCELVPRRGELVFKFHPDLKPHLLQLKKAYTQYQLSNILTLTSSYSIRLYELMKKWERVGKIDFSLDELRLKVGAVKKTFVRYHAFKTKVLERAINEINEKTDIQVSYKEIKHGSKKVEGIGFTIKKQMITNSKVLFSDGYKKTLDLKIRQQTKRYEIPYKIICQLVEKAAMIWEGVPQIEQRIERELLAICTYVEKNSSIENPVGFILSKINEASETKSETDFAKMFRLRVEHVPSYMQDIPEENKAQTLPTVYDFEKHSELIRKKLEGIPLTEEEQAFLEVAGTTS